MTKLDTTSLKYTEAALESIICAYIRPCFLFTKIRPELNQIHVIISHPSHTFYRIEQRVKMFYRAMEQYAPHIMKKCSIVVEAYAPDEMDDVLRNTEVLGK